MKERMNELALFTGAGGGILASRLLGWNTIGAIEINDYCRKVLLQRQRDKILERFPIWDDIKTFNGKPWKGYVDVISAGFPCQPFSTAGKQKGEKDERNLWPETIRIIREVGPRFCLLENVPRLLGFDYFGTILGDLEESGFDARWKVISAAELGASHRRNRLWIVTYNRKKRIQRCGSEALFRKFGVQRSKNGRRVTSMRNRSDIHTPRLCRSTDDVACYVDRIKAIGNGQVPIVAATAFMILSEGLS